MMRLARLAHHTRGMSPRHLQRTGASSSPKTSFVTALVISGAAIIGGLVLLAQGALRSAVLVDSLPTENTVRTPELGAASDTMLLGLAICAVGSAAVIALIVSSRRRAG